jgi:hypothetical protein
VPIQRELGAVLQCDGEFGAQVERGFFRRFFFFRAFFVPVQVVFDELEVPYVPLAAEA